MSDSARFEVVGRIRGLQTLLTKLEESPYDVPMAFLIGRDIEALLRFYKTSLPDSYEFAQEHWPTAEPEWMREQAG